MRRYKARWMAGLCLFWIILISGCGHFQKEDSTVQMGQEIGRSESEVPLFGSSGESAQQEQVQGISQGNYSYEQLSDEGKQVYNRMLDTILNYEEKVDIPTTDTALMRQAYQALSSDYGGLFWVAGYTYTRYTMGDELVGLEFAPNYTMEEDEQEQYQAQVDAVVDEWLGGISFHDSDYQKAKYVFETLIQKVDYVEGAPENQNILSVFLNRETVCQGYACATQYLLRQLGIPSTIVSGYANGQAHAWNLVELDGEYYHMDTTWGNSTYLDTDSREEKFVNYSFLCMADQEISNTHEIQMLFPIPECNSIAHSYYVKEGLYFMSWDPDAIGEVFTQAWKSGQPSVSVKCVDEDLYRQLKEYFVNQQRIADYCDGISSIYYMEEPELCVFTVNFY